MNGVPMVALGLFADQVSGAALVESKGISIRLDKKKLTADIIYKSIIQVATNSRYAWVWELGVPSILHPWGI